MRGLLLILMLALLACSWPASAATIAAASGEVSDVQKAVDVACDGDVVAIPAGKYVWSQALKIGTSKQVAGRWTVVGQKHLTLQGAGIDRTIIVHEAPPHPNGIDDSLMVIHTLEGKPLRITGMTISGGSVKVGELAAVRLLGTSKQVRVDHIKFDCLPTRALYINGDIYGVVDHCQFLIKGWKQAIWVGHESWGGHRYGDGSWASPLALGTEKAIYIEDNLFRSEEGPASASATVDSWMGGRFVFRYNRVENMTIGNHGTESSGRWRGCFSMEIYGNTFRRTDPLPWANLGGSRSGTCVLFDNVATGSYNSFFVVDNYREFHHFEPWGACDGTGPYDDNDGVVYETGAHSGPDGASVLKASGKQWKPGQWVGYSIHNLRRGDSCRIAANTEDTISVFPDSYTRKAGPFVWNTGEQFKIMKAKVCLDSIGRSSGLLLSGDIPLPRKWPEQKLEPLYCWNNTLNGKKAGITSRSILVQHGREYYNETPRPGYKPYAYPHPLIELFEKAAPAR